MEANDGEILNKDSHNLHISEKSCKLFNFGTRDVSVHVVRAPAIKIVK